MMYTKAMNHRRQASWILPWLPAMGFVLALFLVWMDTKPSSSPAMSLSSISAETGSGFLGRYADPNHPNCRREIVADGDGDKAASKNVLVKGTDGDPGCPPDGSGEAWTVRGIVDDDANSIVVDFSPKGGPADLTGRKIPEGILWRDGNTWTGLDRDRRE